MKLDTRTHKMLAYKIHDHFAKQDVWLSKMALAWGSMKPDFIEGKISHFKDETMEIFYQQFNELKEMNPDQNPYSFAVKLGELFHYIADYFCRAHNDPELNPGTLWEKTVHIFHEWKLNQHAQNLHPDFFKKELEDKFVYKNDLETFIEKEHADFLDREYSFENDLASAFKISVLMTNKLIYEMQLKENYAFAHVFNLRHRLLYQNA
ncbi:zinc dependent phospholipase C [Halanaerobium saccharolyticum]|uniref:Zinc dependent phospholipase C n=1 Tax=Halanaerobium saccharolyticum TaxID=43595 RepID=A0A4R7Z782_9FIRM|nr:zinc dependent phospholipase C family protein [Halanaerobium saccharolyticum]RAK09405.1 zinc dependent phospholipase C [Halanaerobium saccharolyticum]TDW06262.1 zinc dependent phospholipase C [Halanaerobium saccharolyticum]TDX61056.1 zinc dependent phospholipase C [Halanaerobium saccharolyticum]